MEPRTDKQKLDNIRAIFKNVLLPQLAPPPEISIAQWADENVRLGAELTPQPGPWRTDYAPYQHGIMDAIKDRTTERIIIMKAARVGITFSAVLNPIGYYVHHDPCAMIVAYPTGENVKKFSKKILTPFLLGVRAIRHHFVETRRMESNNTHTLKMFPGGSITLVAANSPNALRSDSAKVVFIDECDAEIEMAEGNFIDLLENRAKTYTGRGRKIVILSTPKIKGASVIESEYLNSSMDKFHLPCPSCGVMQSLEWQRIRYDDATHYCIECEEHHSKHEWTKNWEKTGVWVSQDPGHTTRGFHLSALYSPFVSWETFIEEFHKANSESKRGQLGKLQAFVNTTLGETWEIQGETADETGLMERRTEYHAEVPDGVCCYTIAVDTQDNRLCVDIIGWGAGKESWRLGYFELQGDPRIASHQVWERLDEIITQPRSYANGVVVPRACVTIDMGGHATEQVRAYAKARRAWNVWAVRGIAGDSKALLHSRVNSKLAGTFEFNLAVNAGKDDVIARLKVKEPGPGYCHFPRGWEQDSTGKYISTRGYDERYFSMLTAEKKVMVKKKDGRHKYEWQVQPNRNNEAFDLAVYNLAALEISGFPLERVAEMMPWVTDKPHPNNGVKMPMPAKERIKPAQVPLNRVTINKTGLNRQASRNTHAFL